MYGAGECFAAATGSEPARHRVTAAFEALRFLATVTQGGPHSPPRGFVARTVVPASDPDPNLRDGPDRDRIMRETRDRLWKTMDPRWPARPTANGTGRAIPAPTSSTATTSSMACITIW